MTDVALSVGAVAEAGHLPRRGVWRDLRGRALFWVPVGTLAVLLVLAVAPGWVAGWFGNGDPRACLLSDSADGPVSGHPFGFDRQGCDVFANVVHGARASLTVGLTCTLLAFAVAVVLGTVAGLRGGIADRVVSRVTDVFLGFPFLLGAIVVLNSFGERSTLSVSVALALFSWPAMARLVRSSVRSVRDAEYVQAARAMGFGTWRVVSRHVLPNAIGPVLAIATITVGQVIVAESTLTFLGVGLRSPAISWGLQLSNAQAQLQNAPHLLLFPGLFLAVTVLSLITLGDVLRDALDPRQR
jgi:ABC-type dipeptide/oligopeptide/nickel transport system permease subunit